MRAWPVGLASTSEWPGPLNPSPRCAAPRLPASGLSLSGFCDVDGGKGWG